MSILVDSVWRLKLGVCLTVKVMEVDGTLLTVKCNDIANGHTAVIDSEYLLQNWDKIA